MAGWTLGLVACAPPGELPAAFSLVGDATGTVGETTATCALDLRFEVDAQDVVDGVRTASGTHGGEVSRRLLDDTGAGFGFVADVFGAFEATVDRDGTFVVRVPINETADGRFWNELARFDGTLADGAGAGGWTCAPLDIDSEGYLDQTVSVDGTWQTAPTE